MRGHQGHDSIPPDRDSEARYRRMGYVYFGVTDTNLDVTTDSDQSDTYFFLLVYSKFEERGRKIK